MACCLCCCRWARQTLEEHAADTRSAVLPYQRLDAGSTSDAWWDAAQRQLVKTGAEGRQAGSEDGGGFFWHSVGCPHPVFATLC